MEDININLTFQCVGQNNIYSIRSAFEGLKFQI